MTGRYLAAEIRRENVDAIALGLEPPYVATWEVDTDGRILGVTSHTDPARAAAFTRLLHEIHDA